jgi:H+/gluconate symporter-like permease
LVIRNVVVALLALGLVVLALTQQPALQTVTAILTGVGTVLAGLFRVFGFFGTRGGGLAAGKSARAD